VCSAVWGCCRRKRAFALVRFGVPWSKRISTGSDGVRAKALSYELKDVHHPLARHVELLDDLVDAEILEVLDDCGHGQPGAIRRTLAGGCVQK
jgi:hypothetical protein